MQRAMLTCLGLIILAFTFEILGANEANYHKGNFIIKIILLPPKARQGVFRLNYLVPRSPSKSLTITVVRSPSARLIAVRTASLLLAATGVEKETSFTMTGAALPL